MNIVEQMKDVLKQEIKEAVMKAGLAEESEIPEVVLEVPKDKSHGDYSTNMAMQLARIAKKAPRNIAEEIVASFDKGKASIDKLDIAGPGFINFYMNNQYLTKLIPAVLEAGEAPTVKQISGAGNASRWNSSQQTRRATCTLDMPAEPLSEIPSAMYLKKRGMK